MGDFNYTCAVSGMPIGGGDEVRVSLVTENPYHKFGEHTCQPHDWAFPRTFPLRAKYDNYGRFEPLSGDSFGLAGEVWERCFRLDLVEVGTGDNQYHDSPARYGMSVQQYLEAARCGRLTVVRDIHVAGGGEWRPGGREAPTGVPNMAKVEKAIASVFRKAKPGDFLVDSHGYGEVRVRCGKYMSVEEEVPILERVAKRLGKYATVLCADSADGHHTQLTVRPKPGTKDYHGNGPKSEGKPLGVGPWVVREDVWQELLKLKLTSYCAAPMPGVDAFREATKRLFADTRELDRRDFWMATRRTSDDTLGHVTDVVPFTVGLGTSWATFCEAAKGRGIEDAEVSAFLDSVAEECRVAWVLSVLRYQWRVSSSSGPQYGDFTDHLSFYRAMSKVADARAREMEE